MPKYHKTKVILQNKEDALVKLQLKLNVNDKI